MGGRGAGGKALGAAAKAISKSSIGTVIPGVADSDLKVKDWFLDKVDLPPYAMAAYTSELAHGGFTVMKTTEKAVRVNFNIESSSGEHTLNLTRWIPKSAMESKTAYKKAEKAKLQKANKSFNDGKKKYEKMLSYAKQNNVKGVRSGMRKETILKKLKDAGHNYEY